MLRFVWDGEDVADEAMEFASEEEFTDFVRSLRDDGVSDPQEYVLVTGCRSDGVFVLTWADRRGSALGSQEWDVVP